GRLGIDLILSNWHVLAGRQDASVGEEIRHAYLKPDGTWVNRVVGRLERWAITEAVDAAVARLTGDRFLLREIRRIGVVEGVVIPEHGMRVRKFGNGTGFTEGTVDDTSLDVTIPEDDGSHQHFKDQVAI